MKMIIPTDGGLRPASPKWEPMIEWLKANRFDPNEVPCDARIEITDGTCLEVEVYCSDASGRRVPERRIERHPMVVEPPSILLPAEDRCGDAGPAGLVCQEVREHDGEHRKGEAFWGTPHRER